MCALQPNIGRYTTGVWTRAYLEQQLRLMLAGRAAEELVFGRDELSSLHQAKLMLAREVRRGGCFSDAVTRGYCHSNACGVRHRLCSCWHER